MPRARTLLIIFACWTAVAFFLAAQAKLGSVAIGRPEPFTSALAVYMTCAYIWFFFTPVILALSKRYRLTGGNALPNAALHILASFFFTTLGFVIFILLSPFTADPRLAEPLFMDRFKRLLAFEFHVDVVRYWAVLAIEHTISHYREAREREVAASQLRAELAETRLEVLKRQLQPHFLFNTLNSISVLMFENVNSANRMLLRLSDLLRAGLASDSPHEVTLERELAFLDRYVEIERVRFGERLTVEMKIDPTALDAHVPNLILQPLVENAIRYGVAAVDRPATVAIQADRDGDRLRLQVRDDGPGLARNVKRGIGLSNTEARLKHLYGNDQRLELTSPDEGGVLVSIAIPYRAAAVV